MCDVLINKLKIVKLFKLDLTWSDPSRADAVTKSSVIINKLFDFVTFVCEKNEKSYGESSHTWKENCAKLQKEVEIDSKNIENHFLHLSSSCSQ